MQQHMDHLIDTDNSITIVPIVWKAALFAAPPCRFCLLEEPGSRDDGLNMVVYFITVWVQRTCAHADVCMHASECDGAVWHAADGWPQACLLLSWAVMKKHIFIFSVNVRRHRLSAKLMRAVRRGTYITCTAGVGDWLWRWWGLEDGACQSFRFSLQN